MVVRRARAAGKPSILISCYLISLRLLPGRYNPWASRGRERLVPTSSKGKHSEESARRFRITSQRRLL
jgi:hypothetical protein